MLTKVQIFSTQALMPKMDHVQRVPNFHIDLPVHPPPPPAPCSETPALQSTCCIHFLRLQPFLPFKFTMGFQGHTSTLIYHSSFPATDLLFPKNRLPGVDRPWNEVGSIYLVKEKQPQVPDIQSLLDEMLSLHKILLVNQTARIKEGSQRCFPQSSQ